MIILKQNWKIYDVLNLKEKESDFRSVLLPCYPAEKNILFKWERESSEAELSEGSWLSTRKVKHTNESLCYSCGGGFFYLRKSYLR